MHAMLKIQGTKKETRLTCASKVIPNRPNFQIHLIFCQNIASNSVPLVQFSFLMLQKSICTHRSTTARVGLSDYAQNNFTLQNVLMI
jgi:hypothetical protein